MLIRVTAVNCEILHWEQIGTPFRVTTTFDANTLSFRAICVTRLPFSRVFHVLHVGAPQPERMAAMFALLMDLEMNVFVLFQHEQLVAANLERAAWREAQTARAAGEGAAPRRGAHVTGFLATVTEEAEDHTGGS